MNCWKCHSPLDVEKIHFRTSCPKCHSDQHVCVNCKHYAPGKPNSCLIEGTEYVKDREAMNFCEDFSLKTEKTAPSIDKKKFNSLFKDEEI